MRMVVAALFTLCASGIGLAAQNAPTQPRARDCDVQFRGVKKEKTDTAITTHFESRTTPGGRSNDFAGGGVDAICSNTDQRVTSDSAEHFGELRVVYLIGRVHYTEAKMRLDADRITYYLGEERLVAEGNVVGRTSTGTRFTGPRATYLRARAGLRARSRLDAGGRPDAWVSGSDAGSPSSTPGDSVHLVADSVISDNDSLVYARGKVIIDRKDLTATSDSAMMDQGREIAALRRSPRVVGKGEKKFELTGVAIDLFSKNRSTDRVRSSGDASATSEEMQLRADTIDLRLAGQKLDRATAWGKQRAHATQSGRDIIADSIDVEMPGQVVRRMVGVRGAKAESVPDSTQVKSKERDWLAGDTIVATFDTVATGDTAKPVMRRLEARGRAQSWQQGARSGVPLPDPTPAINVVTGRVIAAQFNADKSLDRLRVTDQVVGVMIQPQSDTAKAKPKKPPAPDTQRPQP